MSNLFAKSLKRWRGNVRQKNAAEVLGVPLRTFQKWEECDSQPDTFKRAALVKLMAERKADPSK